MEKEPAHTHAEWLYILKYKRFDFYSNAPPQINPIQSQIFLGFKGGVIKPDQKSNFLVELFGQLQGNNVTAVSRQVRIDFKTNNCGIGYCNLFNYASYWCVIAIAYTPQL